MYQLLFWGWWPADTCYYRWHQKRRSKLPKLACRFSCFFSPLLFFFSIYFYSLEANYNIVVVFAIHWHESAMDLHVFPIPIPPPASFSIPSLWVFPVHQPWAPVSWIQPGLVICFTLDNDNPICKTEKETQTYRTEF